MSFPETTAARRPDAGQNPCAAGNGLSDEIPGGGTAGHETVYELLAGVAEERIRGCNGHIRTRTVRHTHNRSGIAHQFYRIQHHDPIVRCIHCTVAPNIAP